MASESGDGLIPWSVKKHRLPINLRKYTAADQPSLVSLWQNVFPDDPPHNEPAQVIAAKIAVDDLIFVAEHNNQLIAACMAGYDGHRGWLYAVAVDPDHRRQGIGESLVRHTLDNLREIGCIKVNLQIRASNIAVKSFYQSLGFNIEDRLSMGKQLEP